jgi:hypothetical protein
MRTAYPQEVAANRAHQEAFARHQLYRAGRARQCGRLRLDPGAARRRCLALRGAVVWWPLSMTRRQVSGNAGACPLPRVGIRAADAALYDSAFAAMATFLPKLLSRAGSDVGRLGNRHALATTEHLPSRGRLGIGLTSGIASRGALPAGAASSPPMTRTELAAALMARGQQAVPLLSAREMLHADQTRARPSRAHPARRRW